MLQITAHFDGKNLCPDEPISLPRGVPLQVTIDVPKLSIAGGQPPRDVFSELQAELGLVEGPPDWAAQHDHYLYGAAKKADGQAQ
jgi:hypothetical protein